MTDRIINRRDWDGLCAAPALRIKPIDPGSRTLSQATRAILHPMPVFDLDQLRLLVGQAL